MKKTIMNYSDFLKESTDIFSGDKSVFSDFLGRELEITRDDKGLIKFEFDSMGWFFETQDIAEGCAIIKKGKYSGNSDVRGIEITPIDKENIDLSESVYWLTGGNKFWNHETSLSWDELSDKIVKDMTTTLETIINESETIGDLIDGFNSREMESLLYEIYEDYLLEDDEDDEN